MKIFQNLFRKSLKNEKNYLLLTGGQLNFTKDLINGIQNRNILVLHKNYDIMTDNFYKNFDEINKDNSPSIHVLKFDVQNTDDQEELNHFLKSKSAKVFNKYLYKYIFR